MPLTTWTNFESYFIQTSAILGLIPRKCPKEPLAELFWELKTCNTDHDCWPRICCPDGTKKYCRTSRPELDTLPAGRQFAYRNTNLPFNMNRPLNLFSWILLYSNRRTVWIFTMHTATTIRLWFASKSVQQHLGLFSECVLSRIR